MPKQKITARLINPEPEDLNATWEALPSYSIDMAVKVGIQGQVNLEDLLEIQSLVSHKADVVITLSAQVDGGKQLRLGSM